MNRTPPEPRPFSKAAEALVADLRRLPFGEPLRQVRRPTKNLAELLEPLLVKYHIGRDSPEHTLRERWAELVGGANAAYSHPVEIDPRGRLLVLTSHAIVRNELFLHRDSVLKKIRAIPGCDHIKTLQLRAG
ncbi:Protein of unknown function (DUF721) [Opitutaceae bacterium TAV1]|nr:hypothetical protein OPIT5_25220 [Opitutaceae bacterium TAV5]EIQ00280.1 Protein of unknown function (DUF721) [Opitutaceae bacterium TAV1]